MIELLAGDFSKHSGDVRVFEDKLQDFVASQEVEATGEILVLERWYLTALHTFTVHCERIGLRLTVIPLRDALRQFENDQFQNRGEDTITMGFSPAKMIWGMLADGLRRFDDETEKLNFLVVEPSRSALYTQRAPLFGAEVAKSFPSIIGEITEIGKCLALGRPTASAFHSIRAMEAGIRAMSRCLGIPDPTRGSERSWFKMLEKIDTGIKTKWPTTGDRMSGDGQIFEELYGALSGMQNPYRNATAHLDRDYNDDDARHVMELCRGLLKRIAKRMDESGMPLA